MIININDFEEGSLDDLRHAEALQEFPAELEPNRDQWQVAVLPGQHSEPLASYCSTCHGAPMS